ETEAPYQETINSSSIHIQIALRKRTFDFKRSQEVLSALKDGSLGAMEREKPKLSLGSLKGKKYLAPLTTVVRTPSEYSLVKRHPCEKIFGVQLAGGFPDTMAKAAQILVDEMEIDFIDINMGCPIDVVNQKGGGCALPNRPNKMVEVISAMRGVMLGVPLTVKIRTGLKEGVLTADETIKTMITSAKPDLITFHPRSKEQRYTKLAKWDFVNPCLAACGEVPLWVCGDVLSWEDYYQRLEQYPVSGIMIGRGALIKPWIFTEIDEFRTWDISANERLDLLKKYIPVGLLERLPQRINDRPPLHRGRNELETLLSSPRAVDWIEISRMLLGPTPEGFTFIPKHKASSY
ncbi:dihydrouridine synthase, partial [Ancylostoma ceylanicum]